MKKSFVVFLSFVLCVLSQAQNSDSLFWKRPALQAEIGVEIQRADVEADPEMYRKSVPGDKNLSRAFSESKAVLMKFPGAGIYTFSYHRPYRKTPRFTTNIGLSHREALLAENSFWGDSSRVVDSYTSSTSGQQILLHEFHREMYQFVVSAMQINLPVGIRISTDREKLLWFQAGFELSPGLLYAIRFNSLHMNYNQYVAAPAGETPQEPDRVSYALQHSDSVPKIDISETLPGAGFVCYAGFPLTMYLRGPRSEKFYGRFHILLTCQPMYMYRNTRHSDAVNIFSYRMGIGLRCRL